MNHKLVVKIAIVMIIVFGATVLLYPMLWGPETKGQTPIEAPPPPVQAN